MILFLLWLSLIGKQGEIKNSISSKENVVTFEQFGAKGNGEDDTAPILKAITYAKQMNWPIRLEGKKYIFSPRSTVDITGIPEWTGEGTLDLTKTGPAVGNKSMTAIFQISGTKKLLQRKIKDVEKGRKVLWIEKNLSLKRNAVLFLTSAEALPNPKRDYYCKGQRCVVAAYDNKTGKLEVQDPFFYSIQDATLWWNDFQPLLKIGPDLRFETSPMNFITCFRFYYARGIVSGYFKNFALTAIMFKSSWGTVEGMEAELPVNENNGYSYCIQVADMSDVRIIKCRLSGGRHVVSGGGGGLWEKEESGGKGHAGYPSVLEVNGGIYKGNPIVHTINEHIGTLDSHGLVERMVIRNCTVYGGINLGANYVTVDSCIIYADKKRILNVGSDVLPGTDWGHYTIRNCRFIGDPATNHSLIYGKANVKELVLEQVEVEDLRKGVYLADLRYFTPGATTFNRIRFKNSAQRQDNLILKLKNGNLRIDKSELTMAAVKELD